MPSVTVPGPGSSSITTTYTNSVAGSVAQQIANALATASLSGSLNVQTVSGSGTPPAPTPGKVNELIVGSVTGGVITVPSGPASTTGYVVVVNSTQPETIYGGPNTTVLGGSSNITIIDPATITLSDVNSSTPGGNDVVMLTATDTGAIAAGNSGNDTIAALGANQSIAGGSGTNVLFDFGTNDTISAQGRNDTIAGGSLSGGMVINSGSGAAIFAGTGGLTVVDPGILNTIVGSSGALVATVGAGGGGDLVVGRTGTVVATDTGNSDTVAAGTGAMSVTGSGNNLLTFGGTGGLQFVDAAGSSTVLAAAGAANSVSLAGGQVLVAVQPSASVTVNGSSGFATLYGGALSNVTLLNSGSSSVLYAAGFGNETLNGAGAKAANQLFGGLDSKGADSIVGGTGNDTLVAGSGADTLVGNGANNLFVFFHANGGAAAQDYIGGYQSNDLVVLSGYGTAAASIAQAGATSSGGNTTITLADNTKITFLGVSSASSLHLASN
jgi:Ca2+-binding RTX toxin-like protein